MRFAGPGEWSDSIGLVEREEFGVHEQSTLSLLHRVSGRHDLLANVHPADGISASVPQTGKLAPLPAWKRLEVMRDVLPAADAARVAAEASDSTTR